MPMCGLALTYGMVVETYQGDAFAFAAGRFVDAYFALVMVRSLSSLDR
jgi:hypothetical protein